MKLRGHPISTNALTTTARYWVQCFTNWNCAEHRGQDTAVELYSSTCLSISLNRERNVEIQVTAASNELSLTVCKRWRPNRRRRAKKRRRESNVQLTPPCLQYRLGKLVTNINAQKRFTNKKLHIHYARGLRYT
jgi:hypothetical protein